MGELVGHHRAVTFLERSLQAGRLAHAYLFTGPPHVGKATLAHHLSQALFCSGEVKPCQTCSPCRRIAQGVHPDVLTIGLLRDEKTGRLKKEIGIDQIKEVASLATLPPYEGKHKVFILDGAEYLSPEAANAFLKTLEEPPPGVVFLLLSAAGGSLLPTLISRCQRIELKPVGEGEVARFLEGRGVRREEAQLRARLSGGCPGRGLEEAFFERRSAALQLMHRLMGMGVGERFAVAAELAAHYEQERDPEVLSLWLGWWRDLLLLKAGCPQGVLNRDWMPSLSQITPLLALPQIKQALYQLQASIEGLRRNASPRLALEVLMLSLPRMEA